MNPLELVGKKVRYEGREGWVRSVCARMDREHFLTIMLRVPIGQPGRCVRVPECEWNKLQILSA